MPDNEVVLDILKESARRRTPRTYADLSRAYHALTGEWHEPHGSWDAPLGEINTQLHREMRAPPISALVIVEDRNEPGRGFWGSAPSVPAWINRDFVRLDRWNAILQSVFECPW